MVYDTATPDPKNEVKIVKAADLPLTDGQLLDGGGEYVGGHSAPVKVDRLDPAIGTVFNIADCEEKLGRLATSWTLFQEVVQRLPVRIAFDSSEDTSLIRAGMSTNVEIDTNHKRKLSDLF